MAIPAVTTTLPRSANIIVRRNRDTANVPNTATAADTRVLTCRSTGTTDIPHQMVTPIPTWDIPNPNTIQTFTRPAGLQALASTSIPTVNDHCPTLRISERCVSERNAPLSLLIRVGWLTISQGSHYDPLAKSTDRLVESDTMFNWDALCDILRANQRFALSSHIRPDADAIGSEMGLAGLLEQMGKQVRIVNPSATPKHLKFLDPTGRAGKLGDEVKAEQALDVDVHLIVDTSGWQQLADLRPVLEKTTARKVVIDHHVSSDDLGATQFKDTSASATGVLITELAGHLGLTPTPEQATALFAAIATDTGWFRFSNTDARTLDAARRLITQGAIPATIYRQLYEQSSLARLKLHGRALSRVAVEGRGRLAHTYVVQADFDETGSHPSDTEDLVNDCLTIDAAEVAFMLVEQKNGQIKVSLRSRTQIDVARIAEQFQGGGHKQASGAMLPGPLFAAQERIRQALLASLV